MTNGVFGIDFGTTNSLASIVIGERAIPRVDRETGRPHPSVVWYRGGGDTVVGRSAREHMDLTETGAPPGFVRSPKAYLRRDGPIFVDGQRIDPTDTVAEVLRHIKTDAAEDREGVAGHNLKDAVMTIPVDFGGTERRALRRAANKAGIGVVQFVHEPVAALYAYLRSKENLAHELAKLEGRSVLVVDWGGGTLDLTLCRILGGYIMQVTNLGQNEVGGDQFDDRLRNFLREKHAKANGIEDITALEQPGKAAQLLHRCEIAKILLSDKNEESARITVRNYLKIDGSAQNLRCDVSREELYQQSKDIVNRGLACVDKILEQSQLTYQDIELCLATGGMVNMPSIRDGLKERFLGRVPYLDNGDRIISEGAAWIAHDELRLTLSKPIEILVADTSGYGTYYPLVERGLPLPHENETQHVTNTRLFCTDPREGVAVIEFAKPAKLGRAFPTDPRRSLCVTSVKVDPVEQPLIERIECHLQIDHDYVAKVTLKSSGAKDESIAEFHDLDFGLSLARRTSTIDDGEQVPPKQSGSAIPVSIPNISNLAQRTNILVGLEGANNEHYWKMVPGDLADRWKKFYFDNRTNRATPRQLAEREFYLPCAYCKRNITQIRMEGQVPKCISNRCGIGM